MVGTTNVYAAACFKLDLLGPQKAEDAEDIHEFDDVFPHLIGPDYQEIELSELSKSGEIFLVVHDGFLRVHTRGLLESVMLSEVPPFNRREAEVFLNDFKDWTPPVIVRADNEKLPNKGHFIMAEVDDAQLNKGNVCFIHDDNLIYNQDYGDVVLSRQSRLWKIVHHYMRPPTFELYVKPDKR